MSDTGYRLQKGVSGIIKNAEPSGLDVEFSTNSYGFRSRELGKKEKNDFRILILGDSITLGDYLPQDQTYSAFVERDLLSSKAPGLSGKNFQVINGGVGGIGLEEEFAILMESGLLAEPDIVLIGLYLNDAYLSPSIVVTQLPKWLRASYLLRFVMYRLDRLRFLYEKCTLKKEEGVLDRELYLFDRSHKMAPVAPVHCCDTDEQFNMMISKRFEDWGYAWSDDYWVKIGGLLDMMKQVAEDHQFKLAVVYFPVVYQVRSKVLKNEPQREFERMMKKKRILHLDLLPLLRKKYQEDGVNLFYDQCHYRTDGNKFVGQAIANFLAEQVIQK